MLKQISTIFKQVFSSLTGLAFLMIFSLASCRTDIYNKVTADTEDYRKKDTYIYGDSPEAEPRQTQNKYENTPESEKKAIEIRKKMFGENKSGEAVQITTAVDSTKTDSTKAAN
ncbi:MAG: hypothetical protein NW226_01955 [Microscillaceae bacterium]|nr:hypothetical protein [Microscillaceae bacterium]